MLYVFHLIITITLQYLYYDHQLDKLKRGNRGEKKYRGVKMVKVHYMHVWKYHDKIPYHVQFDICQ
jgi:hypothetical protein